MYNPNKQCQLFTDTSKIGIGAVLKQKKLTEDFIQLDTYLKNYSVSIVECLTINH